MSVAIPFVDVEAQYRSLKADIDARMAQVLAHGQFILGPEVAELERNLARFCSAGHCVTCASGTDALLMALMAEGVGPGDAVFVPTFTFTASAEVILLLGATPVFVDVDPDDFNIDVNGLAASIATVRAVGVLRPRAIIAVDLYGLAADYSALQPLAERENLLLIADAAQSFGGTIGNKQVGTLAPVTATSFFPAKPLGCFGDGGALFTDDQETAALYRSIRAHGKGEGKYDIVRIGINGRLDTLQAAVLLAKLPAFAGELQARERLARKYDTAFGAHLAVPKRREGRNSAWAQYTIKVANRDQVATRLKEKGVPSAVYYPRPMHLQPAYEQYGHGPGSLPHAEKLCDQVLSLPMHGYMDEAVSDRICSAVLEAIR